MQLEYDSQARTKAQLQTGNFLEEENAAARALAIHLANLAALQVPRQVLQRKGGAN